MDQEPRPPADGVRGRFPALYDQLREIAARVLAPRKQRVLAPTELVHESFVKLQAEEQRRDAQGRSRLGAKPDSVFKACFGAACLDVLADHQRRRGAEKRGGGREPDELNSNLSLPDLGIVDTVAVQVALQELVALDPQLAELVEARVFGGASVPECAELLAVSPSTIDRKWRFAVAWLRLRLE